MGRGAVQMFQQRGFGQETLQVVPRQGLIPFPMGVNVKVERRQLTLQRFERALVAAEGIAKFASLQQQGVRRRSPREINA